MLLLQQMVAELRELVQRGVVPFVGWVQRLVSVYFQGIRGALQREIRINVHVRLRRWVFRSPWW
jgi:hypothetical protein